jgi:hypothetical protein
VGHCKRLIIPKKHPEKKASDIRGDSPEQGAKDECKTNFMFSYYCPYLKEVGVVEIKHAVKLDKF